MSFVRKIRGAWVRRLTVVALAAAVLPALVGAVGGKSEPTVGLLNIGEEEIKGAEAVKEAGELLRAAAADPGRHPGTVEMPRPVTLEDNVWLGFDSVVLPGVTLGRGAIVGCKTIVTGDVAPYEVVVGDPMRVVRRLEPDDTQEQRERALRECAR